uniref:Uncharacterized protein n=1 Tax=Knipowitschia caucasica TaxID=637954 RepID=A0AAV2JES9_KNICA
MLRCLWGGVRYSSCSRRRGRLLSFLVGQAKMAVYVSRRRMVQDQSEISPRALLVRMVQARLRLEFGLYRINGDQEGFEERWGFREMTSMRAMFFICTRERVLCSLLLVLTGSLHLVPPGAETDLRAPSPSEFLLFLKEPLGFTEPQDSQSALLSPPQLPPLLQGPAGEP